MNIYHIGITTLENKSNKTQSIGGIQGHIADVISFLIDKNISVGFIGTIFNFRDNNKITYHEIEKENTGTNKFLIKLFLKSFIIKTPKNAILHAHRADHYIAFSFFKKNPSVITLHGQQRKTVNDRKGKLTRTIYNFLERQALAKCNTLIAVDDITKKYYHEIYPKYAKKITVIPTSVDTKLFRNLNKAKCREKLNLSQTDKIILYVGRIEPPKKIKEIIQAVEKLIKQDPSYKLLLIGKGVQLDEMKLLVKKLHLENNVFFTGAKPRKDLPDFFNASNVSVLYSENEGSPLSVKESLACGIPVVANNVGDVITVIKNDFNGYIAENNSIDDFSEKIKMAIENEQKLSNNCIASIQHLSQDIINQQIVDKIYNKLS